MYFSFREVSIAYGEKIVLDRVSLSVPQAKTVCLIGANGCGKSSLIKLVSGAVESKTGGVYFYNRPLASYPARERAKSIAYMPQLFQTPPDTTVESLVSYGRFPYRKFPYGLTRTDFDKIDEAISLCSLESLRHRPLGKLSGGEKQRARLAMTLAQGAELLILDEPTTYLDVSYQLEVLDLVREINREKGITILMVLHDLNLASRYSDYICSIQGPDKLVMGPAQEIFCQELIRDTFGLKAQIKYDDINGCSYYLPLESLRAVTKAVTK